VLAEETIRSNPEKGTPIILKALLLNELGRYKEGFQTLQGGRQIQRRHPAIHYGHCQFYRNLGQVELAERSCRIAVEQHLKSPESHFEYSKTLAAMGRMEEANRELKEASRLDPRSSLYPYHSGMNYNYLNQPEEAEKAFLKAVKLNPEDQESAYQLGYLYTVRKETEKALSFLNPIWEKHRGHPKADAARTLMELIRSGNLDQLPPQIPPAKFHLSRSQSLYQEGKYGLSLFEIQTAARLNPNDPITQEILIGLSSLLMRLDVTEKAVRQWIEFSEDKPQMQAKGYQELGDVNVMRGSLKLARKNYERSQSLGDPDQIAKISLQELPENFSGKKLILNTNEVFYDPQEALTRKGEVFAHYQMYKRALAIYSMVLRMNPAHLTSKLNSAAVYYRTGQINRAISLLERTLVSHPNHKNIVPHRVLLAKCYLQKNDIEGGLTNLKMIQKSKPSILKSLQSDPAFEKVKNHEIFR